MNHAGIVCPCESLRWPVSISWFISTLTSVPSPERVARIFIGSAMSTSASAKRHLDLLRGYVVLALGFYPRMDVRGLRHLHARRHRRIGSCREVEYGGENVR